MFLETLGCQSNVLESDHLAGLLLGENFSIAQNPEEADVILFNTCSIRQHAEDKIFSRLGQLADWKREGEGRVLGVLGCMATSHKERLLERAPHLDLVVGPDQYPKVPQAIRKAAQEGQSQVLADFDPVYFPQNDPSRLSQPHKAFLEIMKGCDKFCTFCVVPFTRGREVSRAASDILAEASALAESGVKEVTLLGQNVNSYHSSDSPKDGALSFAGLLRELGEIPGLRRIRFMTSHPLDLPDDLVEAMATVPAVCESIHLPVQCGSDPVLKRMNRKYSVAHYLQRVEKLRASVKGLAITTDLIVGFPGETDTDFQGTLDLLEKVQYDAVYSFKYSPRAGTPAARMLNQVPEPVKDERLARLNETAWRHASRTAESYVGKTVEVLVDGPADRTPGAFYGKTRQNRTVVFRGESCPTGELLPVLVESHKVANLHGAVVKEAACPSDFAGHPGPGRGGMRETLRRMSQPESEGCPGEAQPSPPEQPFDIGGRSRANRYHGLDRGAP